MKIRALVPFSTGTISMEQYEIREVSDAVGAKLVAAKLVTEIKDEGEVFVVKMTLTSESGGTMDHTNVEILNAYQAGKAIMFDITLGTIACRVQATLAASFDGVEYPSFNAIAVNTDHQLVNLFVDPYATETNTFTMDTVEIGGGGDNRVICEFRSGAGSWTCNMSYDEIKQSIEADEDIRFVYRISNSKRSYGVAYQLYDSSIRVEFVNFDTTTVPNGLSCYQFTIDSNGNVNMSNKSVAWA